MNKYNNIAEFCLFIGYPRSGHSLVASLLDAHPEIIMGMEWGLMQNLKAGYKRYQIFYSLHMNSVYYREKKNNVWTGYNYKVENGWQGKFSTLKVIGDKKGGRTSIDLKEDFSLLEKLENKVKLKPKLIHIVRNPFDIITTMTNRSNEKKSPGREVKSIDLLPFIKGFFDRTEVVHKLIAEKKYDILNIYHEDFIADTTSKLEEIIRFLNLKADNDYLRKCSEIVYESPKKTRYSVEWTKELITYVETKLKDYPLLSHYQYKD